MEVEAELIVLVPATVSVASTLMIGVLDSTGAEPVAAVPAAVLVGVAEPLA